MKDKDKIMLGIKQAPNIRTGPPVIDLGNVLWHCRLCDIHPTCPGYADCPRRER